MLTWIAHNWMYLLGGYAALAVLAPAGWILMCHLAWRKRRRDLEGIQQRAALKSQQSGLRLVGDLTERALPRPALCQVKARDEGSAPADRAPRPVPSGGHR